MDSNELAVFRAGVMASMPVPDVKPAEPADAREARSLEHVFRYVAATPWAIEPETLAVITDLITYRMAGYRLEDWEVQERIAGDVQAARRRGSPQRRGAGAVALLSLYGVIAPRASMINNVSGPTGTGLDEFARSLDEAIADEEVNSIVIDVNSPGGTADMVMETADRIRAARSQKVIYAVANTVAYSAAYWLASQATDLVVTPSGAVGSIGVYMAHQDLSAKYEAEGVKTTLISAGKYKVEGNPFQELSAEARDQFQSIADEFYGMFVDGVAQGRGVSASTVRSGYGEGRTVMAKAALAEGMVDRIDTLEGTIRRALRGGGEARGARAEGPMAFAAEEPEPEPSEPSEPEPSEPEATIPLESVQYLHI